MARRNRQRGNVNVTSSRLNALPVRSPSFSRVPEVASGVAVAIFCCRFRRDSRNDRFSFLSKKKKNVRGRNTRTEPQNPVFSCYLPCDRGEKMCLAQLSLLPSLESAFRYAEIVEIAVVYRNCETGTLKFYLLKWPILNRWPPQIFIFFLHLIIRSDGHREARRSATSRGRCDAKMIPQIHPSTPLQLAALISRVAKKIADRKEHLSIRLAYSRYLKEWRGGDWRNDQDFLVRDNGTSTFACRGSCLLPSGQFSLSLSLSLLERAPRRNCAAESFLRLFFKVSRRRVFCWKYSGTYRSPNLERKRNQMNSSADWLYF